MTKQDKPKLSFETLHARLAALACEHGCGLVSECRSREIATAILEQYDVTPKAIQRD